MSKKTEQQYQRQYGAYLALINKGLEDVLPVPSEPTAILAEAMRYSTLAEGKRIRPVITLAVADALCDRGEVGLSYALAVEMLHTYSLIHDDLPDMDNDDLRRGMLTCHIMFGTPYAILAGDSLQTLAFEVIAQAPLGAEQNLTAVKILADAAGAKGMAGGQAVDMLERADTVDKLLFMHSLKTGALIKAAARLGCVAAGASVNAADDFAANLGVAFQIRDDILDATASTLQLGKTAGKDAQMGKKTFVTCLGIEAATKMQNQYSQAACAAAAKLECEFLEHLASRLCVCER